MKGIDQSYDYEGYNTFRTEDISANRLSNDKPIPQGIPEDNPDDNDEPDY